MENLVDTLNAMGLEDNNEGMYLDFLTNIGLLAFSNQQYTSYMMALHQIYNLCKGGYINDQDEVFLCNKIHSFKNKNNLINKDEFFNLLLSHCDIYIYPRISLSECLKNPFKVLRACNWIIF